MVDVGRRQPAADEPFHSFPRDASPLTPACEHAVPELAHGEPKVSERIPIARHSVVPEMANTSSTSRAVRRRVGWEVKAPAGFLVKTPSNTRAWT